VSNGLPDFTCFSLATLWRINKGGLLQKVKRCPAVQLRSVGLTMFPPEKRGLCHKEKAPFVESVRHVRFTSIFVWYDVWYYVRHISGCSPCLDKTSPTDEII
jgi:hypothetical protein